MFVCFRCTREDVKKAAELEEVEAQKRYEEQQKEAELRNQLEIEGLQGLVDFVFFMCKQWY